MGKRGPERAYRLLTEYEQLNKDLPREVRRMLALWYVAPRAGLDNLKQVVDIGVEISTAPAAHTSFFYWNAFLIAQCPEVWDDFARCKNNGGSIRDGMKLVKRSVSKDQ